MDLESLLKTRVVVDELKSKDDQGAFQEIADALFASAIIREADKDVIRDQFLARERAGTTSLGKGLAIPHVFSDKVPSAHVVVARSSSGVQMKSPDGLPIRLFFCIVACEAARPAYLHILGTVAKIARDNYWRRYLERANASQICDALIEGEKALCR
jgi:mannitol/fructose-specific phosphotransferase system IIA component (Ntr-type)